MLIRSDKIHVVLRNVERLIGNMRGSQKFTFYRKNIYRNRARLLCYIIFYPENEDMFPGHQYMVKKDLFIRNFFDKIPNDASGPSAFFSEGLYIVFKIYFFVFA